MASILLKFSPDQIQRFEVEREEISIESFDRFLDKDWLAQLVALQLDIAQQAQIKSLPIKDIENLAEALLDFKGMDELEIQLKELSYNVV